MDFLREIAKHLIDGLEDKIPDLQQRLDHIFRNQLTFKFVPYQDFNEEWTDEKLYKKYGLNQEEIDFIEPMIRPME